MSEPYDEDRAAAARQALHAAEEALSAAVSRYEVHTGIRPPNRRGKAVGVVQEVVPGGGMEVRHCPHDHAPGKHRVADLTTAETEAALKCAEAWVAEQMDAGNLIRLPVDRAG